MTNEADSELRRVFRQMPGALWRTDRDLRLTHVVGRTTQDFGMDEYELVGKTVEEFLGTADESDPALAGHRAAIQGDQRSLRYEFRGQFYDLHIEPLRGPSQEVIGTIGVAVDVTSRRDTEVRLADSEARLGEAQRLAHVGSWRWDVDGNRVSWSDELHRIYGIPREQFDGTFEAYLRAVHPEDRAMTENVVSDAYRKRQPFSYEHRIVRPDGEVRMLHTRGDVVLGPTGTPTRMVGSCWDVTDQCRAKQQLERSLSIVRATLDATAEGILVVDRQGKFVAYNNCFVALWRIPDAIVAAQDDEQALAFVLDQLEAPDEFLRRVRELYAYPDAESLDVLRFKDGRIFERRSLPQRLGDDVIGRVWSFRDVTDREKLLRRAVLIADASRLLASLELEAALEGIGHLVVPEFADGFHIDVLQDERGPRRLVAVQTEGNRTPSRGIDPAVLANTGQLVTQGGQSRICVPISARGGVLGAITVVAWQGRRYNHSDLELVDELARRVALAMENAELHREAKEALRARDEFLSVAAHEIRGPVTSLHLAVQSLQRETISPAARRKALAVIERDDRRIARFIDELLDVARVRSGTMTLTLEQVDVGGVLREVASQLGPELARSGSELILKTQGDLVGLWDRLRVGQVFTNLLSNAIKFGLGKPIEVCLSGRPEAINLVVKDAGIGIAADTQAGIFEPFERAIPARRYGGLGLGLFIVRTIVEALGGTIRVESAPRAGATFIVDLPRRKS